MMDNLFMLPAPALRATVLALAWRQCGRAPGVCRCREAVEGCPGPVYPEPRTSRANAVPAEAHEVAVGVDVSKREELCEGRIFFQDEAGIGCRLEDLRLQDGVAV